MYCFGFWISSALVYINIWSWVGCSRLSLAANIPLILDIILGVSELLLVSGLCSVLPRDRGHRSILLEVLWQRICLR